MSDEFRKQIVSMRETYREFQKDSFGGAGIRPISAESKIKADLLDVVLTVYDKHFLKTNQED